MTWDVEGQAKIKLLSYSNKESLTRSIPPFTMKSWLNHQFPTDYVIDDAGQIVETVKWLLMIMKIDHHLTPIYIMMTIESPYMDSIQGKAEEHLEIDTEKHKTQ